MIEAEKDWRTTGKAVLSATLCLAMFSFAAVAPDWNNNSWNKWDWVITALAPVWFFAGLACFVLAWLKKRAFRAYERTHPL